ncbi:TonB-dependent receptor [Haliea sp.]
MTHKKGQLLVYRVIACLLVGPGAESLAADASAGGLLEEVTVTARKTAESLQETPIAVTAFTGADLAARGVASLDEVAGFAPNVEFFASGISGSSSGQVYIRGVGQFDYLLTTDPGVGVYLDGVYLARSLGNILDLVDVERIEVLRGPQGTLYGKNTIGGAINIVARKPAGQPEADIGIRVGRHDRLDATLMASGPLLDETLRAKIALNTKNANGFGDRPLAGDDAGDEESHAAQLMLDWRLSDTANLLLSADYTRADETMSFHRIQVINPQAPLVGLYNALAGPLAPLHGLQLPVYDERWLTDDAYTDLSTGSNFSEQTIWGASATLEWEIGDISLKSITAYRDLDMSFGTDPDGSPAVIIDQIDDNQQRQFSQELQLSGNAFDTALQWVAGVYYLREKADAVLNVRTYEGIFQALENLPAPLFPLAPGLQCPAPLPAPCAGGAGNPVNLALDIGRLATQDQETESYSLYGQASYDLTPNLSVTYGLRFTDESKDYSYSFSQLESGVSVIPGSDRSESWDDVSQRFGLEYRWHDDLMVYASAAKGFKSGGFNGRARSSNEIQPYEPEELWAYEVGVKSEWLDRRLRINGAAFFNDYTDMQFTLTTANDSGTQLVIVGNAAEARVGGFELEALYLPTSRITVSATVAYLDAEYSNVAQGIGITEESKLIGAPEWSGSLGAEYRIPLQAHGALSLRADYMYRDKVYFDAINTESVAQGAYGLLNLRASWIDSRDRWRLSAGLRNATDKEYVVMGLGVLDSLGFSSAVLGRPREWYLEAGYRF